MLPACACVSCRCGGQRTACWGWFFFTVWVPETDFRSLGLVASDVICYTILLALLDILYLRILWEEADFWVSGLRRPMARPGIFFLLWSWYRDCTSGVCFFSMGSQIIGKPETSLLCWDWRSGPPGACWANAVAFAIPSSQFWTLKWSKLSSCLTDGDA